MSNNRKVSGQYNDTRYNYPNAGNPLPQGRNLGGPNENSRNEYIQNVNRIDLNSRFQNDPRSDPRCKKIDNHELMKQQMLLQGPGDDNANAKQPTVVDFAPQQQQEYSLPKVEAPVNKPVDVNASNAINAIEDTYLTFDSFYKNESSIPAQGNLIFSITNINNN